MKELFLDANAHIPVSKVALDKFIELNNSNIGHAHPLAPSKIGRNAATLLENARLKFANLIGAENASNIIFTQGCTQASEWAVKLLKKHPDLGQRHIFCSRVEHPAVTMPLTSTHTKYLDVSNSGIVKFFDDLDSYYVCSYMNGEIGVIQNFKKLKKKFLFSDMCQILGKVKVSVDNIDMAVFGAHKFGGFGGVGFLYLRNTELWSEFGTGSRYFLDIPGTPNVLGIISSIYALDDAIRTLPERTERMLSFRNYIEPELKNLGCEVIGELENRSPNTTFIRVPKEGDAFRILVELGIVGIYCGLGSACGFLHTGGSPLMKNLGYPSDAHDYLRISQWGEYDEIDGKYFIDKIRELIK